MPQQDPELIAAAMRRDANNFSMHIHPVAKMMRAYHDALVRAGFTEEQAFQCVCYVMGLCHPPVGQTVRMMLGICDGYY